MTSLQQIDWNEILKEIPKCCTWTDNLLSYSFKIYKEGLIPDNTRLWIYYYNGFKRLHPMDTPRLKELALIVHRAEDEFLNTGYHEAAYA
jgi:hypothetical protein